MNNAARWSGREAGIVVAVTTAVASMSLTQTLSVPLLPVLNRRFEADVATVSWVATATLIASAVTSPIVGRMGDMYGKRTLAFVCLWLTLVGALCGVVVDSLPALIAVRALQGVGAGMIPLAFGILRDEIPPSRLVSATSIVMVGGAGAGAGLGPIVAGLVLDSAGIAATFWFAAAIVAASILLMGRFTTRSGVRFPASFDAVGAVGLSVVLVSFLIALTKGPAWGWMSPSVIGLTLASMLTGAGWVWWEHRVDEPAVDLAASVRGPVMIAHLGGVVCGFSSFAQYVFVVQLVALPAVTGHGLGRSVALAGLVQLPGVIVLSTSVIVAARLVARYGAHAVLGGGVTMLAIGFSVGAALHGSVGQLVISVVLVNLGLGPAFCALPILILHTVEVGETSAVNAVNSLSRQLGSVTASALAGSIMASSSVVIAGVSYPAHWTFVAIYALAGFAAGALAVAMAATRRRRDPTVSWRVEESAPSIAPRNP